MDLTQISKCKLDSLYRILSHPSLTQAHVINSILNYYSCGIKDEGIIHLNQNHHDIFINYLCFIGSCDEAIYEENLGNHQHSPDTHHIAQDDQNPAI